MQVQGFVNTLADLRGMLASVERVNSVVAGAEVDEWLAHGLEREARGELRSSDECATDIETEAIVSEDKASNGAAHPVNGESKRSVCQLAWSGDVELESKCFFMDNDC